MSRTRLSTKPAGAPAPRSGQGTVSRELVGWALHSPLRHDRPLSPAITRKVLATALGVEPTQLDAIDADSLQTALRHMRALVAQTERTAAAAAVDDLTGALRRGTGITVLQREVARSHRVGGPGVVVAFIDVDGLKLLNDREGHGAGDQLLRDVVGAIQERIRSYDLVFRYGGDEFVCALIDVTLDQARRTMADILANVRERTGGHTFSSGFAHVVARDTADSVLERADAALYRSRKHAAMAELASP